MKTLEKIAGSSPPKTPAMHLDSFQEGVLKALHLEFFFDQSRFLVTPEGRFIAIGKPTEREQDKIEDLLSEQASTLRELRRYLIHSLALHSPLLETNSYVISTNLHLVIARMIPSGSNGSHYEVKLYTIHPEDLPKNYKDKIYLGRAFLSLSPHENDDVALRSLRASLDEQFEKLRERIDLYVPEPDKTELEKEYFAELQELIADFNRAAGEFLKKYPGEASVRKLGVDKALKASAEIRELKHLLIEIQESVRDMERRLLEKDTSRAARYVTKFKKDINNAVSLLLIKGNERITDAANGRAG